MTHKKSTAKLRDEAKFWRAERFDDLECLKATFVQHHYPKHLHDTYAIGVVESGAERFYANGVEHVASAGQIVLFNPQVLHDGRPGGEGFSYRVFYPSMDLMAQIQQDLSGTMGEVHFKDVILNDPDLVARFLALHDALEQSGDSLAQDSLFTVVMADLIRRHSAYNGPVDKVGHERSKIRRVREILDEAFGENIALQDLADAVSLNRYHLLRVFKRELGITPHAYQTMRKIQASKQKLERGDLPVHVALDCGFCDQSHLNRVFKQHVGLSPGQYQALFDIAPVD